MKILVTLFVIFVLQACGIKGKPLPPLPEDQLSASEVEKMTAVSQPTTVQPLKTVPTKKKKSK
jgi:predicted small lipoprotein YifL